MDVNFRASHFPPTNFSARANHARRSEGGPNLATVKNFNDKKNENMTVPHLLKLRRDKDQKGQSYMTWMSMSILALSFFLWWAFEKHARRFEGGPKLVPVRNFNNN